MRLQVFRGANVKRPEQAKEPDGKSLYKHMSVTETETRVLRMFFERMRLNRNFPVEKQDTHGRVYSHR